MSEQNKSSGYGLFIGVAIIVIIVIVAILIAIFHHEDVKRKQKEKPSTSINVEVAKVTEMTIPQTVSANGSLEAENKVTISSDIDDQISKVNYVDGQEVKKGDVILTLQSASQQADLQKAKADLAQKTSFYQRNLLLQKQGQGYVSQAEIVKLHADVQAAQASVNSAKAALNKTKILAPIAGTLGKFDVHPGDHVKAGDPMVTLVNKYKLKSTFQISETNFPKLRIGQEVQVASSAYSNMIFEGKVSYISPSVSDKTRSATVEAIVDNKSGKLAPGMFVTNSVIVAKGAHALVVPEQSITQSLGGPTIFKVVDGNAVSVKVTTADTNVGGCRQVVSGLQLGDEIVIAGQQKLSNGMAVTIVPTTHNVAVCTNPKPKVANAPSAEKPHVASQSTMATKPAKKASTATSTPTKVNSAKVAPKTTTSTTHSTTTKTSSSTTNGRHAPKTNALAPAKGQAQQTTSQQQTSTSNTQAPSQNLQSTTTNSEPAPTHHQAQ